MMKINFSLILLFVTVSMAVSQTTLEEYNYLTKGYKVQIESGLDMKDGYELKYAHTTTIRKKSFNRAIEFKYLYRENDTIPCALLLILTRTDTDYKDYLCIPSSNSTIELWEKSKKDFFASANNWNAYARDYTWGMFRMISNQAAKVPKGNLELRIKYLFHGEEGVLTFLEDGTYSVCKRCTYSPNISKTKKEGSSVNQFKEFNKYLLLEDGSKMEFYKESTLLEGWKIFDFEIL